MKRLLIHVEGSSEETSVKELVAPYLQRRGFATVSPRLLGNSRQRARRGGIRPWSGVRDEIVRHMREDRACYSTTMVDFYGLPADGDRAWPGRAIVARASASEKADMVERAIKIEICHALQVEPENCRFVPFLVMHEFEGLLFANCRKLAAAIGRPDLERELCAIRDSFPNPEEINDSPLTAPSKRVQSLYPSYQKVLMGNVAALEIGIDQIRTECPHFSEWLNRLELLA